MAPSSRTWLRRSPICSAQSTSCASSKLQAQAILNAIRGQWDAAQFGPQSVEAILVALNPGLQGKVNAIPFDPGR